MPNDAMDWRQIEPRERALLMHLLRGEFHGRAEILEQLQSLEVKPISPEGSLRFRSSGPLADVEDIDAPSNRANDKVPIRGFYDDDLSSNAIFRFASLVMLVVHVTDGKISELEIYKEDGSTINNDPYEIELSKVHFY